MISQTTKKCGSTVATFTQLFGSYWGKSLKELSASDGTMSVRGFVSSEGISNKRKQFVYLNGRFAKKSSLEKGAYTDDVRSSWKGGVYPKSRFSIL